MTTPVLPQGTCDAHFHIFESPDEYPFIESPSYVPAEASLSQYWNTFGPLGVERCVLIQPSVYGRDHRLLKKTLRESAAGTMRGVAVLFEDTSDEEIEELHALGVRGARCNALFAGGVDASSLKAIAGKIRALGWHIQLLIDIEQTPRLVGEVIGLGVPAVVDHFGHAPASGRARGAGLANLLGAMKDGSAWVKFSGGYRVSRSGAAFDDEVKSLAARFLEANPRHIVWGSDWPHPGIAQKHFDTLDLIDGVNRWLPQEYHRELFSDNPSALYWGC